MKTSHTHTIGRYVVGFMLSLTLTIIPYMAVVYVSFDPMWLIGGLVVFAIAQLFVQIFFFFHLDSETRPRWSLIAFLFMLLIVGIVVIGSIWIMANLNYNMMPVDEMDAYMREQAQKGF